MLGESGNNLISKMHWILVISSKEKNEAGKRNNRNDINFEKVAQRVSSESWHWSKDLRDQREQPHRAEVLQAKGRAEAKT